MRDVLERRKTQIISVVKTAPICNCLISFAQKNSWFDRICKFTHVRFGSGHRRCKFSFLQDRGNIEVRKMNMTLKKKIIILKNRRSDVELSNFSRLLSFTCEKGGSPYVFRKHKFHCCLYFVALIDRTYLFHPTTCCQASNPWGIINTIVRYCKCINCIWSNQFANKALERKIPASLPVHNSFGAEVTQREG